MLSVFELGVLYALARDHWSGQGAIIDARPLLGASTFAMALGIKDNERVTEAQRAFSIYSYDLWIADDYYSNFVGERRVRTKFLLGEFNQINSEFADYIVPHQGDFRSWQWPDAPIEIIFLDLAKSWELNAHFVKQMLPRLMVGGVLIQQDYVHFNEYWIHLTMEYFADHFEFADVLYGGIAFYRLVKPLTLEQCSVDLKALPYERKMELLENARRKMPIGVQEVMKSAAAKCAIENGKLADAEKLLQEVSTEVYSTDPVSNFSGIATSNKSVVERMLADATARVARVT